MTAVLEESEVEGIGAWGILGLDVWSCIASIGFGFELLECGLIRAVVVGALRLYVGVLDCTAVACATCDDFGLIWLIFGLTMA